MSKKESYKAGLRRRFLAVFDEVQVKTRKMDKTICDEIGMTPSIYSQIKSGLRGPTNEHVIAICDKYGYDLLYVIRGDHKVGGRKPADKKITMEDLHREIQDLKQVVEDLINPMLEGTVRLVKKEHPLDPKEWVKKIGKS